MNLVSGDEKNKENPGMVVLGDLGMAPDEENNKWENLKLEGINQGGLISGRLIPKKSPDPFPNSLIPKQPNGNISMHREKLHTPNRVEKNSQV